MLRSILLCDPILLAPNSEKPFKLMVDASDHTMGAVLMQPDEQNIDHPVAFFSKKFSAHQRNYSTIEKEALSLLTALLHFEVYLRHSVHVVDVFTDHNPIVFLKNLKGRNQRLLRWSLILQEFPIHIRHVAGRDNVIADSLSSL